MPKSLKTWGRVPVWGLQHTEMTDVGSGTEEQVLFATNISWSSEIKDYEQSNHLGQIQGYLVYDATMNWSMTANVDAEYEDTFQNYYATAQELVLSNDIGRHILESPTGLNYDPDDAVSILKTVNITQTNDGAAELSLDGTIYYFSGEGNE